MPYLNPVIRELEEVTMNIEDILDVYLNNDIDPVQDQYETHYLEEIEEVFQSLMPLDFSHD